MKKFLVSLILSGLIAVPAWAATCTFSTTNHKLFSAGGTCAGAPTNADDCVINANINVQMDGSQVCGSLTVGGGLFFEDGSDLTIGDAIVGTMSDEVTISDGGVIAISPGSSLLMNTTNTSETDEGRVYVAGYLSATGSLEGSGTVVSQGAFVGDSWDPRTLAINIEGPNTVDAYNGMVLVPQTGWFRHQWFDIIDTTNTTLVLNADSRGAFDTRNIDAGNQDPTSWNIGDRGEVFGSGLGNATVANGSPNVVLASAIVDRAAGSQFVGAEFICDADLDAANDTDFVEICAVPTTTTITLCDNYGTATCAAGAAFRIFQRNNPPSATVLHEEFVAGDTFIIINPAVIGVPAGSKSLTDHDQNMQLAVVDGGALDLKYASVQYAGLMNDAGSGPSAVIISDIDNANAAEGVYMDTVEIGPFNGTAALLVEDSANITFYNLFVHDALDGGNNAGSEAHGIRVDDTSDAGRSTDIHFIGGRVVRTNDWHHSWFQGADSVDTVGCADCSIRGQFIGWSPVNNGQSIGCVQPAEAYTNLAITDNFITGCNGRAVSISGASIATEASTAYVAYNVIINTVNGQVFEAGSNTDATSQVAADLNVNFIANYVENTGAVGVGSGTGARLGTRGTYYSNFFKPMGQEYDDGLRMIEGAYGNVILIAPGALDNANGIAWEPSGSNLLLPTTVYAYDNLSVAPMSLSTTEDYHVGGYLGTSGTLGADGVISHNTYMGARTERTGTDTGWREYGATTTTVAFSCNAYLSLTTALNDVQAGNTTTSDTDLIFGCQNGIDADATATNTISSEGVLVADAFRGDATIRPGSPLYENLCGDGYPIGVRVAGPPNISRLKAIYPHITPRQTNNVGTAGYDTDGDGIYDLHDNCDLVFNPLQTDTDSDGVGDSCS